MKTIKKIAIANRGEVACRIHRTCKKLGIKTVLLHSEPDIKTKAYRLCDETFNIGPGPTSESYLNIEAQIKGALACKADAIHPGFGFLSENCLGIKIKTQISKL
jgi:3-methylcrotonyl-CoA carboxylase alpha subunit